VGGVEGRAVAYTRELMRAKSFVEVIALAPSYGFSDVVFEGTTLYRYPSSVLSILTTFKRAAWEISQKSIDSVFLLSGALTLFGALMLLFCKLTGRSSVAFLYGKDILGLPRKVRWAALSVVGLFASRLAVNSRFTSRLLPGFLSRSAGILYPGVNPEIGEHITDERPRGTKRVLFVGRLVERKGADDLLRAFSFLVRESQDVALDIVGDGPDEGRLRLLAKELGVEKNVRFYGRLTGKALHERYSQADVLAMPSRTMKNDVEGFGTVFLEAAVFGKPSIGTMSGGIPEAITHGDNGLLVKERDVSALEGALKALIGDDERRLSMGENAKRTVLSHFTWKASTGTLVGLMQGPEARDRFLET